MDGSYTDYLRKRFAFEEWRSRESRGPVINDVRLETIELRGLRQLRVDRVSVPGARAAYQAIWSAEGQTETLVRVDVIEMPTGSAAREMVLTLLGEFQSADLQRSDRSVGEVSFSMPGITSVIFARHNVVAMLRNAGPEVVSVRDFAHELDQALVKMGK